MILLLSCYELGHPPHALALARAFLERAHQRVELLDLSVQSLNEQLVHDASVIAISTPMHTALRLGLRVAARIRALAPAARVGFYGSYATLNAEYLQAQGAAFALGAECWDQLATLAQGDQLGDSTRLKRPSYPVPVRTGLPGLDSYTRLVNRGQQLLAGYTEASRGCKHRCRHCPLPPVYQGRFFVIPPEAVVADVAQQVAAGARHITFGDADFFNGPRAGMRVARAVHERWPDVTFDVTIKVSHLLQHAAYLPELAELGCAFVVSAVESLNDKVLDKLQKGHTRADVENALRLTRAAGLVVRPTFVPFTPWTQLTDLGELVDFLGREQLVSSVDPVQLTIRLLVPPGSLLLELPDSPFGPLDHDALAHPWHHADARVDELQRELTELVATAADRKAVHAATFDEVHQLVHTALHRAGSPPPRAARTDWPAPRLTEEWFC